MTKKKPIKKHNIRTYRKEGVTVTATTEQHLAQPWEQQHNERAPCPQLFYLQIILSCFNQNQTKINSGGMAKENLGIMGEVWASHAIGCGKNLPP